jgi:hypothetical protein
MASNKSVGYKGHRKGTKIEAAHRLYDAARKRNPKVEKRDIVGKIVKQLKVKPNTAYIMTLRFKSNGGHRATA